MDDAVLRFHQIYYGDTPLCDGVHKRTRYHGLETHKCPLDLWIYQEILFEIRPTLVVELGTYLGGTTLFLAHQLELIGQGEVLSVDNRNLPRPTHPRIGYLLGDTRHRQVISAVAAKVAETEGPVLVIHDADHHYEVVFPDLLAYGDFVTPGSYLIVEDSNLNGHPVNPNWGPGPWEAVEDFLARRSDFQRDESREKFMLTYNPGGYLRRTK